MQTTFPGTNGWWPTLSDDGAEVLLGTGGTFAIWNWRTGGVETSELASGGRGYPIGWLYGEPLIAVVSTPAPVDEPVLIRGSSYPALNILPFSGGARGGSWCVGRAADGGRVWWDGIEVPNPQTWVARCEGDWIALAGHAGIEYRHRNGASTPLAVGEVNGLWLSDGLIGYGQNARAYAWDGEGEPQDVTVPGCRETAPVILDGWAWTVAERGGKTYVQGRVLGSNRVLARECPSGSQGWLSVAHAGGEWVIASCHDGGVAVVNVIPDTEQPQPWPDTLPTFPTLAHPAFFGPFWAGTYRPGPDAGGDNAATHVFGNAIVFAGESAAAVTADPWDESGPFRWRILGADAIFDFLQSPDAWAEVGAFYVAAEASAVALSKVREFRDGIRWLTARAGYPQKPVVVYLAADVDGLVQLASDEAPGLTIPCVQLYLEPGQGPDDLWPLYESVKNRIPGPWACCAQGYDRNGAWHGSLTDLVPVYYRIAADLGPRHFATLVFSYKRGRAGVGGGIYYHAEWPNGPKDEPQLHEAWKAFARAVPRP
jgi:hypothetical protein